MSASTRLLLVAHGGVVVAAVDELALDRRDLLQPAVDLGGDAALALLEPVELGLGLDGLGLRGADAVDDPAVLVADAVDELRARDQVLEAVGLEDHRDDVGLVGLVDLDQPVGQRVLGGGELRAQLAPGGSAPARSSSWMRASSARFASRSAWIRTCRVWSTRDVALERVDPVRVARDRRRQDALAALVLSISCFFSSIRDEAARRPRGRA